MASCMMLRATCPVAFTNQTPARRRFRLPIPTHSATSRALPATVRAGAEWPGLGSSTTTKEGSSTTSKERDGKGNAKKGGRGGRGGRGRP
jgi:hypothetical protein